MSIGGAGPSTFLAPLDGKTTTFVLDDRSANIAFARMIGKQLALAHTPFSILDLDAFYSSNADRIFNSMDPSTAASATISVPEPGSDVESELSKMFEARQSVVIVDSLNSLHHLVSLEDGSSRSRKLTFALAGLSYFARTNKKAVILSMYRREGFFRGGSGRSISGLSDGTAFVQVRDEEIRIRSERGQLWPGGEFSIRIP